MNKALLLSLSIAIPYSTKTAAAEATNRAKDERPNVIIILADDLGYADLSCFGSPDIKTPNIDQLAADGVKMTRFYSSSNISSPSRRALLTGRYQSRLGEWAEGYSGTPTKDAVSGTDEPCFTQFVKQAGYKLGSFGKWNIGEVNGVSTPNAHGFDYWIGSFHNHSYFGHKRNRGIYDFWENGKLAKEYEGQYSDDVFIDKAMEFIEENRSSPFLVYLPLCAPHTPYQDPKNPVEGEELSWWNEANGTGKSSSPKFENHPKLKKMVEHMDDKLGEMFDLLKQLQIDENTLIILASDNGGTQASLNTPYRGYKQGILEGGLRIPVIMRWKSKIPAGQTCDQMGIMMDFAAIVMEATDSKQYAGKREFDGENILPVITQERESYERGFGLRRRDWTANGKGMNSVWAESYVEGDWKYIKEFKEAPGYARSVNNKVLGGADYIELLYNVTEDPHESKNLAQENPKKFNELKKKYEKWRKSTVNTNSVYNIPVPDQYAK